MSRSLLRIAPHSRSRGVDTTKKRGAEINLELFAGAGGLAIGLHLAGLQSAHLFELDAVSCQTLRANLSGCAPTLAGEVQERDVAAADWSSFADRVGLLSGGAPCQPFSHGGKMRAARDARNMFPQLLTAVRAIRPKAVLIENVGGLLRPRLRAYFEYILGALECPSICAPQRGAWPKHLDKIKRHRYSVGFEPEYVVQWRLVDAADYGVPQNRRRVFIVAVRADQRPFVFPRPTHSRHSLRRAQAMRSYWEERGLPMPAVDRDAIPDDDGLRPWRTVRDALIGLPHPQKDETPGFFNHVLIPGARSYPGHSGSRLDWPSKALKAGVHGVPGGENTLVDSFGTFRYYTFREAARIQTFPDGHQFLGSRVQINRQIGNAVPCELARAIASPLRLCIAHSAETGMVSHDVSAS